MRTSSGGRSPKYERTRLRSVSALPTYRTRPCAFFIRYTPGPVGRRRSTARSGSGRARCGLMRPILGALLLLHRGVQSKVVERAVDYAEQPIEAGRRAGDLGATEPADLGDLAELRLQLAARDVCGEDERRVASPPGIHEDEPVDGDVHPRLLAGLAGGGRMRGLTTLDAPTGEHPLAQVGWPHD